MGNFARVADMIHALIAKPEAANGFTIERGLNSVSYDPATGIFVVVSKGRKVISYDVRSRKGSTTLNNYGCDIVHDVIEDASHDILRAA
ncbi:hypothetical protein [Pseudomonas phage D6]|nr:hypothetical protein [Pseudomonas phage D6]